MIPIYKITSPDLEAKYDLTRNIVTIKVITHAMLQPPGVALEIPCQIFEELINNISKLSNRPQIKPEEITTESLDEVAAKIGVTRYNTALANTIAAVLNTDIKLAKKKKYKVILKLQKQIDKNIEHEVLAVSHEDAFNKAHEKMKHDWPSYKIVDTKSEEA